MDPNGYNAYNDPYRPGPDSNANYPPSEPMSDAVSPWLQDYSKTQPPHGRADSVASQQHMSEYGQKGAGEGNDKVAKMILEALHRDSVNSGAQGAATRSYAPSNPSAGHSRAPSVKMGPYTTAPFGSKGYESKGYDAETNSIGGSLAGMSGGMGGSNKFGMYSKLGSEKAGTGYGFDGFEGGKKGKMMADNNGLDESLFVPPWNINEYHGDTVLPFNASENYDEDANAGDERMIPPQFKKIIKVRWLGLIAFIFFLIAFVFYIVFRAAFTLDLGSATWYGILVLSFEVIGGLAMIPYSLTLILKVINDAPPQEMDLKLLPETVLRYHVRVMIPCYKEPVDVISKTVLAALHAPVPVGCQKSVYLCDDGKDQEKKKFCHSLNRENMIYVSGRQRKKGEMNGKSCNVNNVGRLLYPAGTEIPLTEVIAIFDADQVANPDFFIKTVPMLDGGADVGMVISPQTFYNLNTDGDIFNHGNTHFWHYIQTGYDAWGVISCTGTNFLMRSKAFMQCGGFPEDTLTEDFALGIEFKRNKWQNRYVEEYLAVGEAPEAVRNAFQQRSRWSKGHFQLFFSAKCPCFRSGLNFASRYFYGSVVLAYFSDFMCTPLLTIVPWITIWLGTFPIIINWYAAVAITVYFAASVLLTYTVYNLSHLKSLWFSQVANAILWFAFLKAFIRTTLGKIISGNIVFKSTIKGLQKMADSPVRDVWVAGITVIFTIISFILGIFHLTKGPLRSPLIISLLWCIYNAVPPSLLLWYTLVPNRGGWRRFFNFGCMMGMLIMWITSIGAVVLIWPMLPNEYDQQESVTSTYQFYQTQMVGQMPSDYPVEWRGDAFLQDYQATACSAGYIYNVTTFPRALMRNRTMGHWQLANCSLPVEMLGGFMTNAGLGNIKMTNSIAWSTAMLAWGLLSFPNNYKDAGATEIAKKTIRWGAEYLLKTYQNDTAMNVTYIISRVGNLTYEREYWGRPERSNYRRPAFAILLQEGFSDLGGQVAGGLAAASLALFDSDPAFAAQLLSSAADVYYAANYTKAKWTDYDVEAQFYYNSTSYWDDLAWASAWLYRASKEPDYLKNYYYAGIMHMNRELDTDREYIFDVDKVFWGTQMLMAQISDDPTYKNQTEAFLQQWVCNDKMAQYTTYGRAYHPNKTGLHLTTNVVFLATAYAQVLEQSDPVKADVYKCWVLSQTRYVLGDSRKSFIVGMGKEPPTRTQDRGAACPDPPAPCNIITSLLSSKEDSHELTGALIKGPWKTDEYPNIRSDDSAQVGLEYNPGLTGALAGSSHYKEGLWQICLQRYGVMSWNPVCGYSTILSG